VLDLSYNKFSGKQVRKWAKVLKVNRSLEYLGLAKNKLELKDIKPILKKLGKV